MSELRKSIWIDAAPEIVFAYFTDADRMVRWCGVGAQLEPRPDGVYRLDMGEAGIMAGRFLRVEPPHSLAFEVRPAGEVEAPPSVIEVSIEPEAGGCRITIRQTGLESPFDAAAAHGWDHHLARLSVAVTGGSPGDDPLCSRSMESLHQGMSLDAVSETAPAAELAAGWIEAWERFDNRTPEGVVETCDWVRVEDGVIREIRSFYDTSTVRSVLSEDEQSRLDGSSDRSRES